MVLVRDSDVLSSTVILLVSVALASSPLLLLASALESPLLLPMDNTEICTSQDSRIATYVQLQRHFVEEW